MRLCACHEQAFHVIKHNAKIGARLLFAQRQLVALEHMPQAEPGERVPSSGEVVATVRVESAQEHGIVASRLADVDHVVSPIQDIDTDLFAKIDGIAAPATSRDT